MFQKLDYMSFINDSVSKPVDNLCVLPALDSTRCTEACESPPRARKGGYAKEMSKEFIEAEMET